MSDAIIKAKQRVEVGTNACKKLRGIGLAPAVLYGSDMASSNLTVKANEMDKFIHAHGVGSKLQIDIDGKKEMAILRNIQRSVLTDTLVHAEFLHLSAGHKIKLSLPIHFTGTDSVSRDFVVQKLMHEVDIEALPKDLVDYVTVDVSGMELGDVKHITDIAAGDYPGIEFLNDADMSVVSIGEPSKHIEEEVATEEGEMAVEVTEVETTEE